MEKEESPAGNVVM